MIFDTKKVITRSCLTEYSLAEEVKSIYLLSQYKVFSNSELQKLMYGVFAAHTSLKRLKGPFSPSGEYHLFRRLSVEANQTLATLSPFRHRNPTPRKKLSFNLGNHGGIPEWFPGAGSCKVLRSPGKAPGHDVLEPASTDINLVDPTSSLCFRALFITRPNTATA